MKEKVSVSNGDWQRGNVGEEIAKRAGCERDKQETIYMEKENDPRREPWRMTSLVWASEQQLRSRNETIDDTRKA
ncbi:hypothetical protein LSTR_LSTR012846 [Laodelphax striatellus]|uniref:Uncharacterized protein n=1 Tax=Laodelphax striatellus TaxID=195883 RepID=A0A482XSC4_LAOST|nr:hypothetical protein LSTR_LSTR013393 [Laodelphax striatellus]RZF47831.1 hypothetical protein LSTR_LSTR012846 [Laodelphax striatellus]